MEKKEASLPHGSPAASPWLWLYLAGVVLLFLVAIVAQNVLSRKRSQALKDVAEHLGFLFQAEGWREQPSVESNAPQLETSIFQDKRNKTFANIMSGNRSRLDVCFFDYSFPVGRNTSRQTVATFSRSASLAPFAVAPQSVLYKIGDKLLHKEIRFESDAEFSERFHVTSAHPEQAQAVFTPEFRAFLSGLDPAARWHIEGFGRTLVIYRPSKRVNPEQYAAFVEETARIAESFFDLAGWKQTAG